MDIRKVKKLMDVKDAGKKIAEVGISNTKGAVNICSGIPITVRELAEKIADEYGRRDLLKFGVHGANRMASNSLLECIVFAKSCAKHINDNLTDPNCVIGEA